VRNNALRDVGDQCLLVAGVFPHQAERRMVRLSYFVALGQSAYEQLSRFLGRSTAQLYGELSSTFVSLMAGPWTSRPSRPWSCGRTPAVLGPSRPCAATPRLTPCHGMRPRPAIDRRARRGSRAHGTAPPDGVTQDLLKWLF
jgi:hypothetical protein